MSLKAVFLGVLGLLGIAALAIAIFIFALPTHHRLYTVKGSLHADADAIRGQSFPVLLCVGHGGPLETSGVLALPMGYETDGREVRVLCRHPDRNLRLPFETSLYTNGKPRRLRAYVWLEYHSEFVAACRLATTDIITMPAQNVLGFASGSSEWACHRPNDDAVLGYAIAFRDFRSGDTESVDIELKPKGYTSSRSYAH